MKGILKGLLVLLGLVAIWLWANWFAYGFIDDEDQNQSEQVEQD